MYPSQVCKACGWEEYDHDYKSHVKLFFQAGDRGVWSLGSELILKDRGHNLPTDEASNIRLVQEQTSIPVPKIVKTWKEDDHTLTLMESPPGQPLSTVWRRLSSEQRESIAKQTANYVLELRKLHSDRMESLDGGPVSTNFRFGNYQDVRPCGPFASDDELWAELESRLHEAVPERVRKLLRSRMPPSTPYTFTHGDLSYTNIMVKDGCVTGIINWETAAYMPVWWESASSCVTNFYGDDEEWRMLLPDYMPDHTDALQFWREFRYLCLDPGRVGMQFIEQFERKSISPDELFAYTNGHFLVDEQHQLARRYVKFDLDALCNVATAVGVDPSPVLSVEKMEGGFSKALLMNKENGTEVVAKLPCRIAGPAELTTASEVGVLKYFPRVLQWSSNKASSVGAEYIIMEKAAGVPLFRRWGVMTEPQKLQLVQNLTKLEAQLSAIRFPAYGGLYLRDYLQNSDYRCLLLDDNVDPSQSFSVGPSPDRSFDTQCAEQPTPSNKPTDRGPWTTLSGLGIAIAERELSRISGIPPNKSAMFYRGTLEEQSQLLNFTIRLMPMLDSHPLLGQSAQPTLWHTDLHMGNIYVAPEDSTRIVSIIDFQSLAVMPAFLQSRWPEFLKPPDNYTQGFAHPELPDGYDNMDDESKLLARREWSQAKLAKAYEVSTYLENRPAHIARNIPRVIQELFIRSGEVSEMGVIPLRACLIEIFQNWADLGFTGSCPFSFTEEDIETHERQFVEYQAWHEVQHLAQECLDTDTEGWISPELDIEEKRRQNRELLAMFIERMADEKSPEARRMWPFLDDG
ncbi:kinase-like protein [Aspergillus niger CBS 101883]|uniref:Altered inheritance of mitochondria protein 9, mitochondrial n=3 Tax=Aspergillus niger TaxID=5061 RepID=A2QK71_ASPNC|nr:kinase-like protein [Aspergillus niger CBS 101883]XP_059605276.1 uncharacterized protein An04g09580 [Aspergillus niger]PYH57761.1 kinase-like protein [Aspergillus niger CBS 101883]CAK47965.1 unnamed protein product [Aspergillus niger]